MDKRVLKQYMKEFDLSNLDSGITFIERKNKNRYGKNPRMRFFYHSDSLVISSDSTMIEWAKNEYKDMPLFRVFDSWKLHALNKELSKYNEKVSMIAEYYLISNLIEHNTSYKTEVLYEEEIQILYRDKRFRMALCYEGSNRKDMVAVVAYDLDDIIGVAACSNDTEEMYQIGIDVIEGYRGKGIAKALLSSLSKEILKFNKVPFYGTAFSNIASKNLALSCGYKLAWIEMETGEE